MNPSHLLIPFAFISTAIADFPEWRGPLRNGVLPNSPKLIERIPDTGLKELWESEPIPSNDEGGLASPVVANGRVYVGLVWHKDVPSQTRQIGELVLRQLGYQPVNGLGDKIVADMERTRMEIPPTLRGKSLNEFIDKWIADRLDQKQRQLYSGYISNRFKKGKLALPLDVLEALDKQKERVFATESEMKEWLAAQNWPAETIEQIVAAVPPTRREADDAIVALDLESGKVIWKTLRPGEPAGRNASATPCVIDGKVYAIGSARIWCVDAATGEVRWETPLPQKRGIGSSPLVADGVLVLNTGRQLHAFDAATGKQLWEQKKAGGANASPVLWRSGEQAFVIANGSDLVAVDLKTGEITWTAQAGGDSTPAIDGNTLVVQSRRPQLGIVCYELTPDGARQRWSHPVDALRTQSSPIIHAGHAYLMDDNVHYCFDVVTGKLAWQQPSQGTISSPVLADGKLFTMANNSNNVLMLAANPAAYTDLGKANVRAQWVPSPCIAHGRLILRMKDRIKAWSLLP